MNKNLSEPTGRAYLGQESLIIISGMVSEICDVFMNSANHSAYSTTLLAPHMKPWVEEAIHRLGEKVEKRGVQVVSPADLDLVRSYSYLLKREDIERGIVSDMLCELLVDCVDGGKD